MKSLYEKVADACFPENKIRPEKITAEEVTVNFMQILSAVNFATLAGYAAFDIRIQHLGPNESHVTFTAHKVKKGA